MDFLDETIAAWQPYSDRPLTREDAREIAYNVVGFFRLLREWAEEEKAAERRSVQAERSIEARAESSNAAQLPRKMRRERSRRGPGTTE